MSIRKLFYSFSPEMRIFIRRFVYAPLALFQKEKYENGLPVPPRALIFTGGGDFKKTGERFLTYFTTHGLLSHHRFLDVGSGMGRMALPLTTFLTSEYDGLDIMPQGVAWCTKNISPRFPLFKFHYMDVHNDLYRSDGERSETVSFPISNEKKDYAILISVFTHMLPDEVEHYLTEINRCLVDGGKCFATFFIYNEVQTLTNNHFNTFLKQDERFALMDERVQAANVAFSKSYLWSIFEQAGFQVEHYSKGKWKEKNAREDFQDFVVLSKT